jgi:hypothetical protein
MSWVYEDPPFTQKELLAYKDIRKRLKDKAFVDKLIKLTSLYLFVKRNKFSNAKQLQESAFYDRAKTKPIFDKKTAIRILKALKQKGGESKYPYFDTAVKEFLTDFTPDVIADPASSVFNGITGTVNNLKESIPFADLASEGFHGLTEVGITTGNNIGEGIGGPIGAAVVAPFTAIAAAIASGLSVIEGDLGGAVTHVATWVPIIGTIFNKLIVQNEKYAKVLVKYPAVAAYIPYMTAYHDSIDSQPKEVSSEVPEQPVEDEKPLALTDAPAGAGKRFSSRKHRSAKWKTQRKRFAKL